MPMATLCCRAIRRYELYVNIELEPERLRGARCVSIWYIAKRYICVIFNITVRRKKIGLTRASPRPLEGGVRECGTSGHAAAYSPLRPEYREGWRLPWPCVVMYSVGVGVLHVRYRPTIRYADSLYFPWSSYSIIKFRKCTAVPTRTEKPYRETRTVRSLSKVTSKSKF